jgi:26S proteasome regulatory subunit N9
MRAISLGLVKGRLDQVDAVFHVSFVKPRVLDAEQIGGLKDRVEEWRAKAATALTFMEEHTAELLS